MGESPCKLKDVLNGTFEHDSTKPNHYSVPDEAQKMFREAILANPLMSKDLASEIHELNDGGLIRFTGSASPSVPVNWRLAEALSALKALEAALVNVLLKRKYGVEPQRVTINTDHATLFIMSLVLWTIDPGQGGLNISATNLQDVKNLDQYFPNCNKYRLNASLYRSLVTNIYQCADGRYFQLHASLNPDPTLDSIGLPHDMEVDSYEDGVKPFMEAMKAIDSEDMQKRNSETYKQAGTICFTPEEFRNSEHGKANAHVGLWEIHDRPNAAQPPSWWPDTPLTGPSRPLAGLKVVDLTRIIAAPTITRSLAELGASVMRCTSRDLPDVAALHVDLNWGKWNCNIDLHDEEDREKLRILIIEADVVVSGYRPGVLDKYGFGQEDILRMCEKRSRGIIYVRENCYGWNGPWQNRSGWQQISDAVVGTSFGFGKAMGLNEPVTPIFPHSDYGTGIAGSCAILTALLRRAEKGGSYTVDLALNYYSSWLVNHVGEYPKDVFDKVWAEHGNTVYKHWQNNKYTVPEVMKNLRSGEGGRRLFKPAFFEERNARVAVGDKKIRSVRPVAQWEDIVKLGFNVGTRGNGVDAAKWPDGLTVEQVF